MRKNNPLIGRSVPCCSNYPSCRGDIFPCKTMSEDPNCAYSPVSPQMTKVVWLLCEIWPPNKERKGGGSLQLDAEFNQLMGRPGAFPICRYSNDIYAVINLVLFTDRINTINKYTQEWSSFFLKYFCILSFDFCFAFLEVFFIVFLFIYQIKFVYLIFNSQTMFMF